eukprot:scaffold49521_cov33-Tisochrysis_lutea.AAC.4
MSLAPKRWRGSEFSGAFMGAVGTPTASSGSRTGESLVWGAHFWPERGDRSLFARGDANGGDPSGA